MSDKITKDSLDKIIEVNRSIYTKVKSKSEDFKRKYNPTGINSPEQLALKTLNDWKYPLIALPMSKSPYFSGAILVEGDKKIPFLNTAVPRGNMYFAAWHEIYHLYYDDTSFEGNIHYVCNDILLEEREAELFAQEMLIGSSIDVFFDFEDNDFLTKIFKCMEYCHTSYKSILISLYQKARDDNDEELCNLIKENFDRDNSDIKELFKERNLDTYIVESSNIKDVGNLMRRMEKNCIDNAKSLHSDNISYLKNLINSFN